MGRPPQPKYALGKRLVVLRKKLGLTQKEAAEKVFVTRDAWQSWEAGTRNPSKAHLKLIELLDQGKL
jgi:transcriptional regulator with XRE-family HTH domain